MRTIHCTDNRHNSLHRIVSISHDILFGTVTVYLLPCLDQLDIYFYEGYFQKGHRPRVKPKVEYFYRPHAKDGEGNVFSLSTMGGANHQSQVLSKVSGRRSFLGEYWPRGYPSSSQGVPQNKAPLARTGPGYRLCCGRYASCGFPQEDFLVFDIRSDNCEADYINGNPFLKRLLSVAWGTNFPIVGKRPCSRQILLLITDDPGGSL